MKLSKISALQVWFCQHALANTYKKGICILIGFVGRKIQLVFLVPNNDVKGKYDVCEKEGSHYEACHGHKYLCHCTLKGEPPKHFVVSVAYSQGLDEVRLHLFVEVPHNIAPPTAFWGVLHSFENQSLWKKNQLRWRWWMDPSGFDHGLTGDSAWWILYAIRDEGCMFSRFHDVLKSHEATMQMVHGGGFKRCG